MTAPAAGCAFRPPRGLACKGRHAEVCAYAHDHPASRARPRASSPALCVSPQIKSRARAQGTRSPNTRHLEPLHRARVICEAQSASTSTVAADPLPSWAALSALVPSASAPRPSLLADDDDDDEASADAVPTLYRDRNGWCPYSERVWLTLELKGVPYNTVLVRNVGRRATPCVRWPDGRLQGCVTLEDHPQTASVALVRALDDALPGMRLWPPRGVREADMVAIIDAFPQTFPGGAQPSGARTAFLFDPHLGWDNLPQALPPEAFEATLDAVEALLSRDPRGPFMCGESISAADVVYAPFLERWAAQLPCIYPAREGLRLRGPAAGGRRPALCRWLGAMEAQPAYACRVRGSPASWRRVLGAAPWWPSGWTLPPARYADEGAAERACGSTAVSEDTWAQYAASRPYVGASPGLEAAAAVLRNRHAILQDAPRFWDMAPRTVKAADVDAAARAVVLLLAGGSGDDEACARRTPGAAAFAEYLDRRVCVPRDMGAPPAAAIKRLRAQLETSTTHD